MTVRISWDRYEVALLFDTYERVAGGSDINSEAVKLSESLRTLATSKEISINETYRNVNGMKMQLANVQYLFTRGQKGLSGASTAIREMYELYKTDYAEYQMILKEAIRLTGSNTSIEEAFFVYVKERMRLSPEMIDDYLQKAAAYCHLKQPLLGMTDVKTVRSVQQKIAEGKLLRFRYGKDAQVIRNVTQLYYTFIKSYRAPQQEPPMKTSAEKKTKPTSDAAPDMCITDTRVDSEHQPAISMEVSEESISESKGVFLSKDTAKDLINDRLWVEFDKDGSYLFTKPVSYTYRGILHNTKSWNRLYVEVCGLLFTDHREAFMNIMNSDVPGRSALAFADEQNYHRMRAPKSFAPGYWLEANLDATSIVRKLCGLHQLFGLVDELRIEYRMVAGNQPSVSMPHHVIGAAEWISEDTDYDWKRMGLLLVDWTSEASYAFTKPEAYEYKGVTKRVNKWGKLYVDICGALFEDNHDAFMSIMNGDIPGYNTLAFADEQHKSGMRVARCFAPGYYLESNADATTIVRRIRGLWSLFNLGKQLQISYRKMDKNVALTEKQNADEWIIRQLKARGLTYQDKRVYEGCLWIVGNHELDAFVQECREKGYMLTYKADGCKTFHNQPVWWTKDFVEQRIDTADFRRRLDDRFRLYLVSEKQLAERTAAQYSQSVEAIERFLLENRMESTLDVGTPAEAQRIYDLLMARNDFVVWNNQRHHQYSAALSQYVDYLRFNEIIGSGAILGNAVKVNDPSVVDERWLSILKFSFPDGYILGDFLSQFQAAGFWQERYGEMCPIEGDAIDDAMKAIGTVRDRYVLAKNEEETQLISSICTKIVDILSHFTTVYRTCIYDHYQEQLASCQIYTEQVMSQQLLKAARGTFYSVNQIFAKPGQYTSVIQDCHKVLRDHGGPLPVNEVAKVLWFIPYETVYHGLSVDNEALNIGNGTWMLVEQFPLTREDAQKIGEMLNEYFQAYSYVQAYDLMTLLQKHLPSIADNMTYMTYMAVFNIVEYYLRDQFSFSKAIISPKGTHVDFTNLFKVFASEHETFTLTDIESFASELKLPIYWESTFAGGAVRVNKNDFVNCSLVSFDVDAVDQVLESFCLGDYLPIQAVTPAMMIHLPSCGYGWNGYLLLSYVRNFSKVFRLSYNSLGKTGFYGAMVRKSCTEISNYNSLIERVLTDDDTWRTSEDALNLLVKCGYQAQRKYKDIDTLVEKVRQNKQADGR